VYFMEQKFFVWDWIPLILLTGHSISVNLSLSLAAYSAGEDNLNNYLKEE